MTTTCPNCNHLILGASKRTRAPERLTPPQMDSLKTWCTKRQPWAVSAPERLEGLVESCLDYWRGEGGQRELHGDWVAVCRTWITRTQAFGADQADRGPVTRPRPAERPAELDRGEKPATAAQRVAGAERLKQLIASKRMENR